ncbi:MULTISPECIES: WhiB family transcriptional regulator [unclassified Streptomyces]|uniref:WhiB family transcriptional regulator n=1 Tax=unclassified Streptomyces TaxID=2593676 RepID=UPI002E17015E|nr:MULTISPECIES: WhiB family transcriptional regulator [unclassified Streptomyces]
MTTAARDAADWRLRAACRGQDTNRWFIDKGHYNDAKSICSGCPVRAECLYDALTTEPNHHRYGMWGGLTGSQRAQLPPLEGPKSMAIAALRRFLDEIDHQGGPDTARRNLPDERTEPMTTALRPARPVADVPITHDADVRLKAPEDIPVGQLLKWADDHPDSEIRDQAARARVALTGLRRRHAADAELTAIGVEAEQLEHRLAELRSREAELVPAKRKRRAPARDYDARVVREWAAANDIECAPVGQIPKRVLDAWRARDGA